jgi:hypothetical protein
MGKSDSPARDTAHHREDPLTHALPADAGRPGLLMTVKPAALFRLEDVDHGRDAAASVTAHVDRPRLSDRYIPSLPSVAAVVPLRRKALCA